MRINSFKIRIRLDAWVILTGLIALLICLPIFTISYLSFIPGEESTWGHLIDTVLSDYIKNTISLMFLVGTGTLIIGVTSAWFVTAYQFPGQKVFIWALLLPMAIPAYVIANVYVELLEYAGPVQVFLRNLFGWKTSQDYWFPEIRSLGGAALMMSLVLYPYVFMLSRAAFLSQKVSLMNASRLAGKNQWQTFFQINVPLARPGIVLGLILVLMETVADFGTVEFFAIDTFTRGIYNVWLGMYDINGASRLALSLLVIVILLVFIEKNSRQKLRYFNSKASDKTLQPEKADNRRSIVFFLFCLSPIFFGFLLPFSLLLKWTFQTYAHRYIDSFYNDLYNSIVVSISAAILAVVLAVILAYGARLSKTRGLSILTKIASMGYALPGPIIALGVLVPFATFDNALDEWMRETWGISSGLILSGSIFAIIFAYVVRFLAVSYGTIEAGLSNISTNMDDASRSLGKNRLKTLAQVHIPLLRTSVLTATILVFVDGLKELPATLMLQPFNFSTLATRVFEYSSDQRLQESAPWAIAIVLSGILPVIFLSYSIARKTNHP